MSSTKALTWKCSRKLIQNLRLKFFLSKRSKIQDFQEPVVEYCRPDDIIDICTYNHYPVIEKDTAGSQYANTTSDVYDTTEIEHEFEYGLYEDLIKTEQLWAGFKMSR